MEKVKLKVNQSQVDTLERKLKQVKFYDNKRHRYHLKWQDVPFGALNVKGDPVTIPRDIHLEGDIWLSEFEYNTAVKYFTPTWIRGNSLSEKDKEGLDEILNVIIPYGTEIVEALSTMFVDEIEMSKKEFDMWKKFLSIVGRLCDDH